MDEIYTIFPFPAGKESERFYKLPMVKGLISDLCSEGLRSL